MHSRRTQVRTTDPLAATASPAARPIFSFAPPAGCIRRSGVFPVIQEASVFVHDLHICSRPQLPALCASAVRRCSDRPRRLHSIPFAHAGGRTQRAVAHRPAGTDDRNSWIDTNSVVKSTTNPPNPSALRAHASERLASRCRSYFVRYHCAETYAYVNAQAPVRITTITTRHAGAGAGN